MYNNRIFYVLVGLALVAVIFFTFHEATSTAAIERADRSYDQIELARTNRQDGSVQADASYNAVEAVRLGRSEIWQDPSYLQIELIRSRRGVGIADRSYDTIENLRAARGIG